VQKTGLDIAGIDPRPGVLLRRRREAAGLTQRQLAELAGVSDAVVCRLERCSRAPRLDVLVRLFVALGLQLPLETAPLDDPVEAELEAELKRTIQERFDEAAELKFFDGFDIAAMEDALRGFRHVYCGLTAAGLLGAPVRQIECELMLLGGEETIDRFTVWLDDQWARRWNDDEQHYDGSLTLDPRESGVAR
jgi:transcriptional regulator with XRE-family HTH domain